MKYLHRSRDNKVVGGVLGGLGKYFGVDPVLFRVGYVLLAVITAVVPCVIAYVAALLIIPKEPEPAHVRHVDHSAPHAH